MLSLDASSGQRGGITYKTLPQQPWQLLLFYLPTQWLLLCDEGASPAATACYLALPAVGSTEPLTRLGTVV
jgi:hypothetical protein